MAAYEKLAQLAYRLQQKTIEGEVDWNETVVSGVYQASLADYSIRISLQPSLETPEKDVKISIINEEGVEIESFLDIDIKPEWLAKMEIDNSPYTIMYNTYEVARRLALGTEKAINQILLKLEEEEIPF